MVVPDWHGDDRLVGTGELYQEDNGNVIMEFSPSGINPEDFLKILLQHLEGMEHVRPEKAPQGLIGPNGE